MMPISKLYISKSSPPVERKLTEKELELIHLLSRQIVEITIKEYEERYQVRTLQRRRAEPAQL